jgi:hypothetical protein
MKLKTTDKNMLGAFDAFTNVMRRLVSVPHSEIKSKLDAEKAAKKRRVKPSSVSRASGGKG